MARINIEDKLYRDTRFLKLVIYCGDEEKALGKLIMLWTLAQSTWLKYGEIPEKLWVTSFDILLKLSLVRKTETGYYAAGSKKQFAWLLQKVEAGRRGGLKKAENLAGASGCLAAPSEIYPPTPTLTPNNNKNNNVFIVFENVDNLIQALPPDDRNYWLEIYSNKSESFFYKETKKAFFWCSKHPEKKPKSVNDWIRFLNRWFENGAKEKGK